MVFFDFHVTVFQEEGLVLPGMVCYLTYYGCLNFLVAGGE